MSRFLGLAALALGLSSLLSAQTQQPAVLAQHRPIPPRLPHPKSWHDPAVQGSMVGGLWMTDANFKSSIYLKNIVETDPVTVTPILYLANGTKYTLPDVKLEAGGTAIVDINAGLEAQGISSYATLSGYVEIQYTWPWDPICATIRNLDSVHSVIFSYGLQPSKPFVIPGQTPAVPPPVTTMEGLWWKHESNVTAFVALANTTSQPITAAMQVSDNQATVLATHTVTVSPHGTKLVNLDELQSAPTREGGIRITYSRRGGGLVINGGVEDQSVGYSAALHFLPAPEASAKVAQLSFTELGLMVGAADPMMSFPAGTIFTPYSVLHNVSDAPMSVTPTLWWMAGGSAHSAKLPSLTLPPYRSQRLDTASIISAAGLKNYNGSVNVVLDAEGKEGGLLPVAGSVDQTNNYVFEVIPRAVLESASKSMPYWSTANGDDTMVTLWNPTDEAQDLAFTVLFSGGEYALPVRLDPRASRTFNMSEIIQNQVPDANGNIIPSSVHEGSAKIEGSHAHNEHILVAMDSGIYNVRKAVCNANNCQTCDGGTSFFELGDPFIVGTGGQQQQVATEQWCSGAQYDITGNATWSTITLVWQQFKPDSFGA